MFANLPVNAIADGRLSWGDPGVQTHIKHLDDCEWYEDDEGFLYIVDPEADTLIHGPDNEMSDAMYKALLGEAPKHRLEERIEGLEYVGWMLHRFNSEDGFYHA